MDDADRAQLYQEQVIARQIERAASMARQALGHHATSTTCTECGGEIEGPRIVYGFGLCSHCARTREFYELHGKTPISHKSALCREYFEKLAAAGDTRRVPRPELDD